MKKVFVLLLTLLMFFCMTVMAYAGFFKHSQYLDAVYESLEEKKQTEFEEEENAPKSKVISVMYHKISENPEEIGAFCVSPETFESDILWFKENGYNFCFSSEVDAILRGEYPEGNYVAITFDDGYESDYKYALPILEKHKAKATFFIIGSAVDKDDNIKRGQLIRLAQSECAEIGNHSYEFHNLPMAEKEKIYEVDDTIYLLRDFKRNANFLKSLTGKDVRTISFPNGIWTEFSVSELRKEGYTDFYTSDIAVATLGTPHGRINRYSGVTIDVVLEPLLKLFEE